MERRYSQNTVFFQAQGKKKKGAEFNYFVELFEQVANGSYYDPAIFQLMMCFSAVYFCRVHLENGSRMGRELGGPRCPRIP